MSYTLNVRGATKTHVREELAARMLDIANGQPAHKLDATQALKAADEFMTLLPDPNDTQDVKVTMAGSIAGDWENATLMSVNSVSVSLTVTLVPRAS